MNEIIIDSKGEVFQNINLNQQWYCNIEAIHYGITILGATGELVIRIFISR